MGSPAAVSLKEGSRCEDLLSEIALLHNFFKILMEGPTLKILVSPGYRGRNNSLLLWDEHDHVFLPPNASPWVDP